MNEGLSQQITRLRRERGLTQEQMGQLVGVSAQAVSKWEKGGAPDVELLPVLADRLGVSIDALFGREETAPQDMAGQLSRWIQTIPQAERMGRLFRLMATTMLDLYVDPRNLNQDAGKTVAATCYMNGIDGTLFWLRSQFVTEEGMILGVMAEDFPLYLLLPEPPEGYGAQFAPDGDYRKLFALLAKEGCLELLRHLYGKPRSYYTASALAKQAGLPTEQVEGLLPSLVDCHLMQERSLELDDGHTKVYCLHDNRGLVPLLYFARWFMEPVDAWLYGYDVRTRPTLAMNEEQKQRRKGTQHESKH